MANTVFNIAPSWHKVLINELSKPYIPQLAAFVATERLYCDVYPSDELVFQALRMTAFDATKIVIVGQDPYHGQGQAHGLSFSVNRDIAVPPSLVNIYKELRDDLGIPIANHGSLISWAKQGVLLLNATLTVRRAEAMSHHGKGWEQFTDAIIDQLAMREQPLVFLLWGKSAQEKCSSLRQGKRKDRHLLLTAAHPSPFSAHKGFFGCRHFSQANEFLHKQGLDPIDWHL